MNKTHSSITLGVLFFLFACSSKTFVANPELAPANKETAALESSFISLPINISYESIREAFERQMQGFFYVDDDFENNSKDNIKIKIRRTGSITIVGHNEYVKITLPLYIWAEARWKACEICPAITKDIDFEPEVSFISRITFQPGYEIYTSTTVSNIAYKKDPGINMGPVTLNLKPLLQNAINESIRSTGPKIDETVRNELKLKPYVEKLWKAIQEPILIDSSYKTWIYLQPGEFQTSPLVMGQKGMTINTAIQTLLKIEFGDRPKAIKTNLPSLTVKESIPKNFKLDIPLSVSFTEATNLLRKAYKDTTIEVVKGKKVKINDISIFGNGGWAFVKVVCSGALNGTIYMKGKPTLDFATATIQLQDFDYELNSKQALLKTASWMLKSTIKNKAKEKLKYSVASDLENAKSSINNYLNNYKYEKLLEIKGKLTALKISSLYVNDYEITVLLKAEGQAQMNFLSLLL
jgi:hypothetical protein